MEYGVGYEIGKTKDIGKEYDSNKKVNLAIIQCQCGRIYKTRWSNIKLLKGKGCIECIGESRKTHGMKNSRLYNVWREMKFRCSPTGDDEHRKNYYDRGIRVCDEWQNFENFYEWAMNNGYREDELYESGRNKITIDRIDNDGNYEPSNCRWITFEENQYNKQHTMYANYKGEIKNILEISKETGLEKSTIRTRIMRGKSLYDPYIEKKDPKYLYKGEELTLGEISKKYNIDVKFLRTRMKLGWSIDEAMSLPKQKMRKEITRYKYNNNYYCIAELAKILGLKRTTLQYRIQNGIMVFEAKKGE